MRFEAIGVRPYFRYRLMAIRCGMKTAMVAMLAKGYDRRVILATMRNVTCEPS